MCVCVIVRYAYMERKLNLSYACHDDLTLTKIGIFCLLFFFIESVAFVTRK